MNISSFYPLHVEDHFEKHIDATMVAVALCAFEVAGIICTPLIPVVLGSFGRKNAIILGFAMLIVSNTGLGLLSMVPDSNWKMFWGLSILIRFI